MKVFSIEAVAKATGLKSHQVKYLLASRDIVPDRRMEVGRHSYRYFTAEDISDVVNFLQGGTDDA